MDASIQASLPYKTIVTEDVDGNGRTVYVARNPELNGCMAQGVTPEEAVLELRAARELYIQSLIDDCVDVPSPGLLKSHVEVLMQEWVVAVPRSNQVVPTFKMKDGVVQRVATSPEYDLVAVA